MSAPGQAESSPKCVSAEVIVPEDEVPVSQVHRGATGEMQVLGQEEKPFYTTRSLAQRLSVSNRTAKRMIDEGEIASYFFRGVRRIDPVDVESYLAEHRQGRRNAA